VNLTVRSLPTTDHLAWVREVSPEHSISFLQTPAWGQVKTDWRHESIGWFNGQELVAAALVLHRAIPRLGRTLTYLPEGPAIAAVRPEIPTKQWVEPLLNYLRSTKAFSVKMGPPLVSRHWEADTIKNAIADSSIHRLSEITADYTDERALQVAAELLATGWTQRTAQAGFADVQPRYVFQLDLSGKSLDELAAGFSQEWRRNIRKAEASGVQVREGSRDDLATFHQVYIETAARDGFRPRPVTYFERMWDALRAEDAQRLRLFLAEHNGITVAATTLATVGRHAWYSYGASTTASRAVRPSHATQWAMIQAAHAAGCHTYDLRGISDTVSEHDPLFGLIRFKVGTGGRAVEYIGEFDYPLNRVLHRAVGAYLNRRTG